MESAQKEKIGIKHDPERPFQVGKGFTCEKRVSPDQAKRYAEASGDFNPIHLDEAYAKGVGLKGVILHGLCTMSLVTQAAAEFMGDPGLLKRMRIRFREPVYPGDSLRITGEILNVEDDHLRIKLECRNQTDTPVISATQIEFFKDHRSRKPPPEDFAPAFAEKPYPPEKARIEHENIRRYAIAVGDPHPLYLDEAYARQSPYGGLIAPPLFCSIYSMKTCLRAFDGLTDAQSKSRVLNGGQEFEFYEPLRPGETITTTGGIERRAQKGGQEFLYFVTETRKENKQLAAIGRGLALLLKF